MFTVPELRGYFYEQDFSNEVDFRFMREAMLGIVENTIPLESEQYIRHMYPKASKKKIAAALYNAYNLGDMYPRARPWGPTENQIEQVCGPSGVILRDISKLDTLLISGLRDSYKLRCVSGKSALFTGSLPHYLHKVYPDISRVVRSRKGISFKSAGCTIRIKYV